MHNPSVTAPPRLLPSLLSLALLAGCATTGQPAPALDEAQACATGTPCKGYIMGLLPAFERVAVDGSEQGQKAAEVLKYSLKPSGEGGLCQGEVWRSKARVSVYRLYDGVNAREKGRWWSFAPPEGSAEQYRSAYEICPEWNTFTQAVVCQLPASTLIAVGPGQSATCKQSPACLQASPANQVFIPDPNLLQECVSAPWSFPTSAPTAAGAAK